MSSHVIGPLLCGGLLVLAATTGAFAQSATSNPKPVLPKAGPHSITAQYVGTRTTDDVVPPCSDAGEGFTSPPGT